jgi:glucan-binding YG repeat protein
MVVNDWVKWNGKWYYLNCNGVMLRSRWIKDIEGDWWYYVNENGEMVRNEPVPYKEGYCWANGNGRVYENQELKIVGWHIVGA